MTVPITRRQRRQENRANRQPVEKTPYGYQGATNFASQQRDEGTDYEREVISGKYLTPESNPYLQKYADNLSRQFRGNLARGLSEVSSPFMSGATLGQTGIHGDVRGRYFNEGMQDLSGQLAGLYSGAYESERGRQNEVAGLLSGRTENLRNVSAQNYGTDVAGRTAIQTAKIQANSMLEQARMAQQLGYDSLAADLMYKYEQLQQQATAMEQDWLLRSGALGSGILRDFSGTEQRGPQLDTGGSIGQGILGGGLAGYGMYRGWQ